MAHPALAVVESALRSRQLDRTLCLPERLNGVPLGESGAYVGRALSGPLGARDNARPTGIAALDRCLGGGLPLGQLSEISGPASSGRTALLLQVIAAATRRGEIAAVIDTSDRFDVASAVAAGVDLDRLLWVRGRDAGPGALRASATRSGPAEACDRAVKALNLVLQAGGFGIVAIDLTDVPAAALQRLPVTTWLRVQRAVEGRETVCVLLAGSPLARSAGGVSLMLTGAPRWAGASSRSRRLDALAVHVHVASPRRRVEGDVDIYIGAEVRGAEVRGAEVRGAEVRGAGCGGAGANLDAATNVERTCTAASV